MQTLNKNGIPQWLPKHKRKRERKPLNIQLPMRRFALIDDEAEVEVVVPHFSPIVELLKGDGWREIV
ncbi:ABC-type metal ion transport system, periplasmic component/surface adhesin [Solibacillus silvestris StLB046]|uniref:ABC-type metal ion transport system, periplasmic component/surface adhesin n=1 Tax=Solibacillus silvestris (strain StLB046) TaxID=1002809 RepID=F2F2J2_SOLSS|nr:hypothetical protein [Solibacillus silvestris]BAK15830.1 ABC-type metal ion transport system, periplasmic component/surface adhesin [Solibacillus silvestris StLB046]